MPKRFLAFAALGSLGLTTSQVAIHAAPPTKSAPGAAAGAPTRLRGTVQSLTGQTLTLATASGPVRVTLAPSSRFAGLVASDRAHIKPGSFLGIGSAEQPDGSQRAVEVTIFPEAMRGTGEGSYPWEAPGGAGSAGSAAAHHSRMTNGTVAAAPVASHSRMTNGTVSPKTSGANLTLTYKGIGGSGAQSIVIPAGVPIVMIAPGTIADVKPGAHVFVIAQRQANGSFTAARVLVGKNGLTPPM